MSWGAEARMEMAINEMVRESNNRGKTMSETMIGVVQFVNSKPAGKGTVYSFKLNDEWYNLGFNGNKKPNFNKGDKVKFNWELGKYGKDVTGAVQVSKSDGTDPAPSSGGSKPTYNAGGGQKDTYWADKEKYDKQVTAPLIHFQNATTNAVQIVIAALNKDILPVPAGKKKADQFEHLMEIVAQVRDEINQSYVDKMAELQGVKPSPVKEALKQQEPEEGVVGEAFGADEGDENW
jgi:hypothetical protein